MILTDHARARLHQRFPEFVGVRMLEEFESCRRPTAQESARILKYAMRGHSHQGDVRVSKSGIVFVIRDGAVITLYPLPEDKFRKRNSYARGARQDERRPGEKRWLRESSA